MIETFKREIYSYSPDN